MTTPRRTHRISAARSSRQREVGGGLGAYSEPREVRVMWARQAQGPRCRQGQPPRTCKGKLGHVDSVLGPAEALGNCLAVQWQPTPDFLPGKSHGQRSLVGCGPWGHRVTSYT